MASAPLLVKKKLSSPAAHRGQLLGQPQHRLMVDDIGLSMDELGRPAPVPPRPRAGGSGPC